jgi:hypothetical protein
MHHIKPILVLGLDRSGTSMLTDVLSHWGCWAGDERLLAAASPLNPQGFWEYKPVQHFLVELFAATGTGWWSAEFRPALRELGRSPAFRERAQRLVSEMEVAGRPWVWKEPLVSVSLPFWQQVCRDPIYMITLRNPYLSALSYQSYLVPTELQGSFRTIAYFLLRWQFFMRCILEDTAGTNAMFIAYEDLLGAPAESCRRISDHLGRELGAPGDAADRIRRMAARIDPKLWRQRSALSLDEVAEASPEQKELYACLSRRAQGVTAEIDLARFPMPACFEEYALNVESLRDVLAMRGLAANAAPRQPPAPAGFPESPPRLPPRPRRDAAARLPRG